MHIKKLKYPLEITVSDLRLGRGKREESTTYVAKPVRILIPKVNYPGCSRHSLFT